MEMKIHTTAFTIALFLSSFNAAYGMHILFQELPEYFVVEDIQKTLEAIDTENIDTLEQLSKKVPLNEKWKEKDDATFLGYAIEHNKNKAVEILLKKGASVNAPSGLFDFSPLALAVMSNVKIIPTLLQQQKLNINAKNGSDGKTALHKAVNFRRNEFIEEFIKHGADVNIKDATGATPLNYAEVSFLPNPEAATILKKYGAQKNEHYKIQIEEMKK